MPLTHECVQNHQHAAGLLRFVVLQSWVLEPPAKSVTQGLIRSDFVALLTFSQPSLSLVTEVSGWQAGRTSNDEGRLLSSLLIFRSLLPLERQRLWES